MSQQIDPDKLIAMIFKALPGITLALILGGCASIDNYPGYQWQKVSKGVYLHSAIDPLAGPVDGNSVVIVKGDGVIVVDTHINPAAARAVIKHIQMTTSKPVTHVINTHWHDDHTNGNHVYRTAYPDVRIIAHADTLAALKKEWLPMEEQRKAAYANLTADKVLEAAAKITDSDKAIGYRVYAGYIAALKPELDNLELVYPEIVFQEDMNIASARHRVEVKWLGSGNTSGDLVVWLPREKLLITGDLLVAPIPFAFDVPMLDWITTLEQLQSRDVNTFIPGHGTVQSGSTYLTQVLALLRDTVAKVRDAHEAGVGFSELNTAVDLSEWQETFTQGNAEKIHAWRSYYLTPGLKSAWVSLGYALPEEQ